MSTHAHTPGPWAFTGSDDARIPDYMRGANNQPVISGSITNRADALLIAAAPDMLQSLHRLINAIDRLPGNNPLDGLADEARAIIARATGV